MGVQPPFIYDAVKSERSKNLPYNDFDPKAVTRASFQTARSSPRRKQEGPLVSFNQHPEYAKASLQTLDVCLPLR